MRLDAGARFASDRLDDGENLVWIDASCGRMHGLASVHFPSVVTAANQPFLERLDDASHALLLAVARPVSYRKGARLRGARREGDRLETALSGQIVAAPD